MKTKLHSLTLCLDMYGCPNRCLHCWLGHGSNPRMAESELRYAAEAFRPFAGQLKVFSWYREPDYPDHYRGLWELEAELSDKPTPHFELMSVWRAARDPYYVPWLAELGLKKCQLTLFGGEAMTDQYTGRKGAYQEILTAMEQLLQNGIAPRIQVFVNQENVGDLQAVMDLIEALKLERRCAALGQPFEAFVHAGGCDGANAALYDIRITPNELKRIPPKLLDYTRKHGGTRFGSTEQALYQTLSRSKKTRNLVQRNPVFYIDRNWDVFPNISAPAPHWRLGNLRQDGAQEIIDCYRRNASPAQAASRSVALGEMLRSCANPEGQGMFGREDYMDYILNRYCEGERYDLARA